MSEPCVTGFLQNIGVTAVEQICINTQAIADIISDAIISEIQVFNTVVEMGLLKQNEIAYVIENRGLFIGDGEENDLIVKEFVTLESEVGDLTLLTTVVKDSLVNAINELDGEIGDLSLLTTTIKTSIVNAINELDGEIGDLTTLTTTEKSTIVGAINENFANITENMVLVGETTIVGTSTAIVISGLDINADGGFYHIEWQGSTTGASEISIKINSVVTGYNDVRQYATGSLSATGSITMQADYTEDGSTIGVGVSKGATPTYTTIDIALTDSLIGVNTQCQSVLSGKQALTNYGGTNSATFANITSITFTSKTLTPWADGTTIKIYKRGGIIYES